MNIFSLSNEKRCKGIIIFCLINYKPQKSIFFDKIFIKIYSFLKFYHSKTVDFQ